MSRRRGRGLFWLPPTKHERRSMISAFVRLVLGGSEAVDELDAPFSGVTRERWLSSDAGAAASIGVAFLLSRGSDARRNRLIAQDRVVRPRYPPP
jgi:hypothetical protein